MRDDPFDTLITALRVLKKADRTRQREWTYGISAERQQAAEAKYQRAREIAKDAFDKAVLEAVFNR